MNRLAHVLGVLTTNETRVAKDFVIPLLLRTEISEVINDHTEDQVQSDDNHNEEEHHVIDDTKEIQGFLGESSDCSCV